MERLLERCRKKGEPGLPRFLLAASLAVAVGSRRCLFLCDLGPKEERLLGAISPQVWRETVEVMRRSLEDPLLFQYGGPLLAGICDEAEHGIDRILRDIAIRIRASSASWTTQLEPAFGVASLEPGVDPDETLRRADLALGAARAIQGRVVRWSDAIPDQGFGDELAGIITGDSASDYRRVRILACALAAAANAGGLEEFLREFLDLVLAAFGAQRGVVLLMNDSERNDSGRARVFLARDDRGQDILELGGHSESIPREVYASGRGVRMTRSGPDESVRESVNRYNLRSLLCVRLSAARQGFGVLYLDSEVRDNPYTEQDLRFLQTLADRIAPGILGVVRREKERLAAGADRDALSEENRQLRRSVEGEIVVCSRAMADAMELVRRVAPTEATVLITGESGCGKERVARSIHLQSSRSDRPLFVVNCAAIPRDLIESELFGHEEGAFTGAVAAKKGKFEQADRGTLFLDEVAEIPLELQPKLLRFLQERELEKVGGDRPIQVDIRIIAATNRDLRKMVEEGSFRDDLYFRLNVFPIHVPPLRERRSALRVLFDSFLALAAIRQGRKSPRVSPAVYEALDGYSWPGNVRELENCAQRAMILVDEGPIEPSDLGLPVDPVLAPSSRIGDPSSTAVEERLQPGALKAKEREVIVQALRQARGNKARAARILGIPRTNIYHRIREHGIDPDSEC